MFFRSIKGAARTRKFGPAALLGTTSPGTRIVARGSPETRASYAFLDRGAPRVARRYWIQEVKSDGKRTYFGPAVVRRA